MPLETDQTLATAVPGKYLTVILDAEWYGLPVRQVREIIRLQKITPVPQMPAFVNGVINLRGRVVPVVDLRIKFGLRAVNDDRTCIVVLDVQLATATTAVMGVIVDRVEEVVNLTASEIERAPDFGTRVDVSGLLGMAKVQGEVKMLLDVDQVLGGADLALRPV